MEKFGFRKEVIKNYNYIGLNKNIITFIKKFYSANNI